MAAPSSWADLPVCLAGVILLGKLKELSKIIFKIMYSSVIWLHRRSSSSIPNSSTDLMLCGCDPAVFLQCINISQKMWGGDCPLLKGWVEGFSKLSPSMAEAASTQFLLGNHIVVGQQGSGCKCWLGEEREGEAEQLGKYRAGAFLKHCL